MPDKINKVDEVNQRILDMLKERRDRRQTGDLPLVDRILRKNGTKPPKSRIPKIKEIK